MEEFDRREINRRHTHDALGEEGCWWTSRGWSIKIRVHRVIEAEGETQEIVRVAVRRDEFHGLRRVDR